MAIRLSKGAAQAISNSEPDIDVDVIRDDISFGDGDGDGGRDTINAPAGLDVFPVHSWLKIITPDGDPNRNKRVKVLSSSATKIEVAAGSFAAFSAGQMVSIIRHKRNGSIKNIFENMVIHLFAEDRPSSADDPEPGSPIAIFTLNGGAFTPGNPLNGLNFGEVDGEYLRRAIDPETMASEVWRADPISGSFARSFRAYANDVIQGQSVTARRFDGTVVDKGQIGDMILNNGPQLTIGVPVDITSIKVQVKGADVT